MPRSRCAALPVRDPPLSVHPGPVSRSAPSLRQRLRQATAEIHLRVEEASTRYLSTTTSKGYLSWLERMFGVIAPLEERLLSSGISCGSLQLEELLRAHLLERDLSTLGRTSAEVAEIPRACDLPSIEDEAEAFGCLYVLEGSKLGGRVLLRDLRRIGITGHRGGVFLACGDERAGVMWKLFLEALSAAEPRLDRERIVDSAVATFEAFETWLKDGRP